MSTRANLIRTTGLQTSGNELSVAEGSLKEALNVNIDENAVITPRRGFNDYGNPTNNVLSLNTNKVKQILEYKHRIFRHYSDKFEYEDQNGVFQPIVGSFNEVLEGYRIKSQEANGNIYFTTSEGIKKISVKNNSELSSTSTVSITDAGGLKAAYMEGVAIPTVGGFLPAQSKVAYRYIFGTKDKSENLILGAQSARTIISNIADRVVVPEEGTITIVDHSQIANEDYLVIKTKSGKKYVPYFHVSGTVEDPKKSDTINAIYIKVDIQGLTLDSQVAAMLANELASVISEYEVTVNNDIVTLVSKEEGNIDDIAIGTSVSVNFSSGVTVANIDGTISEGASANVELTLEIPSNATTDYFVQVYRTSVITATEGLELSDLDPGDEMNLVYEEGLSTSHISNGELVFEDTTPESFRASAAPLYTNAITGEGILQSNDAPPIALDMTLFRNSMFYANTKSKHRTNITILSVDDFVSNDTQIIIGNDEISRYYTFSGEKEKTKIKVDTVANTTNGSWIELVSANNERKFYVYFDKTGSATDPAIPGYQGIKCDLQGLTTAADVVQALYDCLFDLFDFELKTSTQPNANIPETPASDEIIILYTNNGLTDGISFGTTAPGGLWQITVLNAGIGEVADTEEGGDVLLSALTSVGQAIDETARSLVKIINKDSRSPVYAYYQSTSEDLPGQILIENRSQEDKPFYIAIYDSTNTQIGAEFSPELPLSNPIAQITGNNTTTTIQTTTPHGFSTGDTKFISYNKSLSNPLDPESFSGIFTITSTGANTFTIPVATPNTVVSFVPPVGSCCFEEDVVSDNLVGPNRLYFSKTNEPEAVPSINYINVGAKDSEIKRILALRDNLFVLKEDGIFVVSGFAAPNFTARLIDDARIIAPDSAVVLNNQIFCLTEQGITMVTDSGAGVISRGIENLIDDVTNTVPDFANNTFGISYQNDRCFLMFMPSNSTDQFATQAFRYNIFERTWTRWEYKATCGLVLNRDSKLYLGNGDRNYVSQERKNNQREDHSDRQFDIAITSDGVDEAILTVSSLADVEKSDVITQTQLVTISYFNNILRKMDNFDNGLVPPPSSTFQDSFGMVPGDSIVDAIDSLNDYLITLDPANITAKTITNNNYRTQMELLIDELNDTATITTLKNYKDPTTVTYEAYIVSINKISNQLTTHIQRPWIEGAITVYKHIPKNVTWNPQHFGDPSALKQIREVTIMFDQNNFYDATARFASDAAQALVDVDFKGKGIGYWGDMPWGDPNHYFGGVGNDIPYRTIVPRGKQKCRYLTIAFEHRNAREYFRVLGISGVVRSISSRAYR